jgi:hypothetical protein
VAGSVADAPGSAVSGGASIAGARRGGRNQRANVPSPGFGTGAAGGGSGAGAM